jgi:hypothetical protein
MFAAQSLSDAHCVRQALVVGSQLNGAQIFAGPVTQLPAPSHTRAPCTAPPLHEPVWQAVPAG